LPSSAASCSGVLTVWESLAAEALAPVSIDVDPASPAFS
jgi:hypothetical protein